MTPRGAALAIIVAATLVRLAVAVPTGIRNLGDYVVVTSRQLSLSTIDHPPMMFWIVGFWNRLTGSEDALLVRLPFIALFAATSWLLFRLTAMVFSERAGVWAVALFSLTGIFGVAIGTWVMPDGPLIFFLLLGAILVARIVLVEPPPARPILWWIGAGAAGGAALLSKYSAAFFFIGVFAYLLTVVDARRWLKTPGPWLGGLVGLLVFSPVLIWNAEHGWESFLFQGGRAVPEGGLSLRLLGENVLLQIALLLPWIFVPLALALGAAMIAGPREPRRWFFVCLAAGPILVFTLVNLWRPGFPHWPMPGWLFVFPLAGATLAALSGPGLAWARRSAVASAVAFVAILAVFLVQAETGLVGRAFPAIIAAGDPAFIVHDWDELPPALGERALLGDGRFVAALDWETVAAAAYALGPGVAVLCLCEAEHQFKYLHDRFAFAGQEAAIVGWPQTIRERMTYLSRTFERTEPDAPVTLTMAGRPVAELAVLKGYGFRPAGDR